MINGPDIAKPETWAARIDKALAAERCWRDKAARIQRIYRGELTASGTLASGPRFNILYANTAILAPAVYQQPPRADVRRRFAAPDQLADAAAEILQKALDAALDGRRQGEELDTAIRACVKDMLIAGRATLRLRWSPLMGERPVAGDDAIARTVKLWETLDVEHVYWEDFLHEPARRWADVSWIAFRHYLTPRQATKHFGDDPRIAALLDDEDWKRGAFIHQPGEEDEDKGGSSETGRGSEGRMLVWECWDREAREVVWFAPGRAPQLLRVDEDPLGLEGFYPCPAPLVAVSTTDRTRPVPEYEIYQDLAAEIDRLTERIDAIAARLKVRGAFNGSIGEMGDILDGEDGEMVPIDNVAMDLDMNKAIWVVPVDRLIQALNALYLAREQAKQALYEVTGISDVLRGASRPSETATAQRIKGSFGTLRIDDRRRQLNGFLRGALRIGAEIMATKFSASTLEAMTGEAVPPPLEAWMRADAMRAAHVDVETDSTIAADEIADQEAAAKLTQALSMAVRTFGPLVEAGSLPPQLVSELVKLLLKPFKGARSVIEILDQAAQQAPAAPVPQPGPSPQQQLDHMKLAAEAEKTKTGLAVAQVKAQADMLKARTDLARAAIEAQTMNGPQP